MADCGRERVYSAEYRLRELYEDIDAAGPGGSPEITLDGIRLTLPPEAKFSGVEQVQVYVNRVLDHQGMPRAVSVRERKGQKKAHYQFGQIAVPVNGGRWALREVVILHELAHHLTHGHGHDRVFVEAFIDLLSSVMGPEAGLAYRILCTHEGVLA